MKNNKGITLLALIITIIVLVILAGVALNTLFGNNGILDNSKYAKEQYVKSVEKEAIQLAFADLKMKLYTDDSINELTAEVLEQQLTQSGYNVEVTDGENGNFVITFKDTGDQYEVTANGSIVGEEQTEVAIQEPEEEDEVIDADEVIYDVATLSAFRDKVNAGEDYTGKVVRVTKDINFGEGNTTNWVPIGNGTYNFKGTFDGGKHIIRNIYINTTSGTQGLFGVIGADGIVKNTIISGNMINTVNGLGRNSI